MLLIPFTFPTHTENFLITQKNTKGLSSFIRMHIHSSSTKKKTINYSNFFLYYVKSYMISANFKSNFPYLIIWWFKCLCRQQTKITLKRNPLKDLKKKRFFCSFHCWNKRKKKLDLIEFFFNLKYDEYSR